MARVGGDELVGWRGGGGGQSLLHHACGAAPSAVSAERLAGLGADVNARDACLGTPLHLCALYGTDVHAAIAERLVGHGADLAAKNERGHTPLDTARKYGCTKLAHLLERHGAPATPAPSPATVRRPPHPYAQRAVWPRPLRASREPHGHPPRMGRTACVDKRAVPVSD